MRSLIGIMGLAVLMACGGSGQRGADGPEPKLDISPQEAVDESVEMFVGVGRAVMKAGRDCDAMAANVRGWVTANGFRNKLLIGALARIQDDALKQRYRDGLGENLDVVMAMKAGLDGCREHKGLMTAWQGLSQ